MSYYINPDAAAWLEQNERLHHAGKPHQWRLFGMIACRLCQASHDAAEELARQSLAQDAQ